MTEIKKLLDERGNNYGEFHTLANLSQTLYGVILKHHSDVTAQREGGTNLPPFMAESLRMICHKLARIANGNPYYIDNWVDISGYATLVSDLLERTVQEAALKEAENAQKTNADREIPSPALVKTEEAQKTNITSFPVTGEKNE